MLKESTGTKPNVSLRITIHYNTPMWINTWVMKPHQRTHISGYVNPKQKTHTQKQTVDWNNEIVAISEKGKIWKQAENTHDTHGKKG